MKKIIRFTMLSLLSLSLIIFTGCNSADKTLAKNLDNTVTNLVYSITNLDFADTADLNLLSTNTNKTNNVTDNKENENITENQISNNSKNANCCEDCNNSGSLSQFQANNQNYNMNENMSGYPGFNKEFCDKPISKAKYNTYCYGNNKTNSVVSNQTNTADNMQEKNETKALVSFSTEQISENNQTLQNLISKLINKRSNLLLYINDLYKGNITIASTNKNAVNAYMNILKDNTSYFNQHRGLVTNQIDQAKELYNSDNSSSLINAYIIRTNEAIATRIAKLESSISAMDSILDIMKGSQNSNSKTYILNNYNQNVIRNNNVKTQDHINKPINTETTNQINNENLNDTQGLENANINTENNNKPTLNNNNISYLPQPNFENKQDFYPYNNPYYRNQTGYFPMPYQPYNWQPFNQCENCNGKNQKEQQETDNANAETNTLKDKSEQNIDNIKHNEINTQNLESESQQTDKTKDSIKSGQQNQNKTVNVSHTIEEEFSSNQDEILSNNERSNKKTINEKTDKKEVKHDNTLNEKIREQQKEIRENKQSQENVNTFKNKISNFFIEDKTNRDRRLKTMNHTSNNDKALSEIKNIEKANYVQF